jgi:hypothetical protein
MLLTVMDSSIPGGSDQKFGAAGRGWKKQFIDIGLAVGDVNEWFRDLRARSPLATL